mgnify:CR=1 FL=1
MMALAPFINVLAEHLTKRNFLLSNWHNNMGYLYLENT